jgi:hypothetical protein
MTMTEIKMKFVEAWGYTRRPCTVCGGWTEKVSILCEGIIEDGKIRACEDCLKAGDIDDRLQRNADKLDEWAAGVRGLVGRLVVPTYAAWQAAEKAHDVAWQAEHDAHEKAQSAASAEKLRRCWWWVRLRVRWQPQYWERYQWREMRARENAAGDGIPF